MGNLFTIGHSTMEIKKFIELLQQHNVNYVVDVRSMPFSKYAAQFNKGVIETFLNNSGISYSHMGKYFGARQTENPDLFTNAQLDFEKVRESQNFKKGLDSVIRGLKDNNIALMCTEKDPLSCHRAIMVGRAFELAGIDVKHIHSDGSLESQTSLNARLVDKYFPDRDQTSLFGNADEVGCLEEAYRRQNKEIGYKFGIDGFEG